MDKSVFQNIKKYIRALEEEILYIEKELKKKGVASPLEVISGHSIKKHMEGMTYSFKVKNLPLYISPHTDTIYETNEGRAYGHVIESYPEKDEVVAELNKFVGDSLNKGILQFDMTFLYKALSDALNGIVENPYKYNIKLLTSLLLRKHLCEQYKISKKYKLNEAQHYAVKKAIGSNFSLIWGPPGTGKTTTIGALVNELFERGNKILILSHTNLAVDTVMNKVSDTIKIYADGYKLIRYGTPTQELNENIPTIEKLLTEKALSELGPYLKEILSVYNSKEISNSSLIFLLKKTIDKPLPTDARIRIKQFLKQIDFWIEEFIKSADIVGTTLARLYIDSKLKKLNGLFDTAIIDEGSTALVPQIIYTASFILKRIVIVGDFNQLPCIATTPDLQEEIFSKLGLNKVDDEFRERPMLNIQYRMHPDICAVINQLFYGGKLRTSKDILKKVKTWPRITKPVGACLIIDSTSDDNSCRIVGETRINEAHLEIVEKVIDKLYPLIEREDGLKTGIITPYRGQANRIKELIREMEQENKIEASTIHSFQGQEKDIIILDLVDAGEYPVVFLNEYKNPNVRNMLNVAISRAKKKLLIIANIKTFQKKVPDGIVTKLFQRIQTWGFLVPQNEIDKSLTHFLRLSTEWSPTKRLYGLSIIKNKLKEAAYVEWNNMSLPLIKIEDEDCVVEIKGKQTQIPIYEIEAFKKGGIKESLVFR